jgi:TolA-binding protein
MIRKLIITVSMLALCITTASAQEKKESGISSWFKELQKKIDIIAPRKNLSVSTGVAGVRGAKEDSTKNKLYWKGKKGDEAVTEDELKVFKEGVVLAEKGDNASAIRELEEFMKQYPDSALIPDAKKSVDLLKAEVKPQETAAPAKQK